MFSPSFFRQKAEQKQAQVSIYRPFFARLCKTFCFTSFELYRIDLNCTPFFFAVLWITAVFRHCIQNLFFFKSCKENCLTYLFVQFSQTGLLGSFLRLCRKIDFFTVCLKNLPIFEIVNKTYLILLVKKTSIIVLTLHKNLDKIYM